MKRIALRGYSLRRHVKDMTKITLNMDNIVLRETFLGTGIVKPEMKAELSEVLKCEVLHVETAPDVWIIIVKGAYTDEMAGKLMENYDKEVRITKKEWLERLMLGLLDKDERLLDIGFLESLDFHNRQLTVSTSYRLERAVKYVKFGYLKIDEEGKEFGKRKIGTF